MKKPYLIKFWHGTPRDTSHFMQQVKKVCRHREADNTYFYDGSLQEFAEAWGNPFVFYPAIGGDEKYVAGTLGITPHGHFGAC